MRTRVGPKFFDDGSGEGYDGKISDRYRIEHGVCDAAGKRPSEVREELSLPGRIVLLSRR